MIRSFLFVDRQADSYKALLEPLFPSVQFLAATSAADAEPLIGDVEALAGIGPMLPDSLLAKAAKLRWLQALSTGVDTLLGRTALQGKLITSVAGMHRAIVSEMALALMLALARNLPAAVRNQEHGVWAASPGRLLQGKTIAILGMGAIGCGIAQRARCFGMRTLGFGSTIRDLADVDAFHTYAQLGAVANQIDFLALAAPHRTGAPPLVGADEIAALKPDACIVNVGRGSTLDAQALAGALREGRLAGAALDAFTVEPLPQDDPLWSTPNLLITPHAAGWVIESPEIAAPIIAANVRAMLAGRIADMVNVVTPGSFLASADRPR